MTQSRMKSKSKRPPKNLFNWLIRREKEKLVQFIIATKENAYTKEKESKGSGKTKGSCEKKIARTRYDTQSTYTTYCAIKYRNIQSKDKKEAMIANKARRWLIHLGKILPFIVCAIVCLSFVENFIAVIFGKYAEMYDSSITLYTPITWYIAQIGLVYNVRLLALLFVISVAIETCIYNKLCVLFLGCNLIEKHYLSQIELYPEIICIIAILNILVSSWLTYKGIKIYIYLRKK